MNYLDRFPFDTVKIYRILRQEFENEGGATIVRTIIALAENLGCQFSQGYYFSRPVPAEVAQVLLAAAPDRRSTDLDKLKDRLSNPIEAKARIGK